MYVCKKEIIFQNAAFKNVLPYKPEKLILSVFLKPYQDCSWLFFMILILMAEKGGMYKSLTDI